MVNAPASHDKRPGEEVVQEAALLLQGLGEFGLEGDFKEEKGKQVLVRVSMEPVNDRFRALITCYAYGHRLVDWTTLRIGIKRKDQPDRFWLLPLLNQRGQVSIQGLESARYSIVPLGINQRDTLKPPVLAAKRRRAAVNVRGAVRTRGAVIEKTDLTVTLNPLKEDYLHVDIETTNPALADHKVEFRLLLAQDTDSIVLKEQVILKSVPDETRWLGTWEGKVDPQKALQVICQILYE